MGCSGLEEPLSDLHSVGTFYPSSSSIPRVKDVEFIRLKCYFSLRMAVVVMAPLIPTLENIGTQCRFGWHLCYRFCPDE